MESTTCNTWEVMKSNNATSRNRGSDTGPVVEIQKKNLHYTRCISPKRVTSSGVHLMRLGNTAPKKHRSDGESFAHCVQFDRPWKLTPDLPRR